MDRTSTCNFKPPELTMYCNPVVLPLTFPGRFFFCGFSVCFSSIAIPELLEDKYQYGIGSQQFCQLPTGQLYIALLTYVRGNLDLK